MTNMELGVNGAPAMLIYLGHEWFYLSTKPNSAISSRLAGIRSNLQARYLICYYTQQQCQRYLKFIDPYDTLTPTLIRVKFP